MTGGVDDAGRQITELWTSTLVWFQGHSLEILTGLVAGTMIVFVLLGLRGLGRRLCNRDPDGAGWARVFGRAIDRTSTFFIVAVAAKLVAGYANAPEMVAQTIYFIFTIAAVLQVATWVREIILGLIERRTHGGDHEALSSAVGLIRLLVTVALFAIAIIVILDNLGVNVTGLVAGLGVGGIAIGLAAQGIFADLFAALSILFDRPFRRGDSISYDQTNATVEAIGLKSTRLRSFTGEERIISNQNLLDKEIKNNTRLEHRRMKLLIGTVYELPVDTLDHIPAMLKEIVEGRGYHFVRSGFVNFGNSSLDFELEFDVMTPDFDSAYQGRHAVGMDILRRFSEEGISFAYPTQTSYTAAPDGRLVLPYSERGLPVPEWEISKPHIVKR